MNSIYFAGALSLIIDCENLSVQSNHEQWHSQVCSQLQSDYDDVRLTAIKLSHRSVGASDMPPVVVGKIVAGRLKVDVVDGIKQSHYLFSVNATQHVWVAKNKMYKGEIISRDDLILKKANVAPFVGLKTFFQEPLQGKMLARAIKKNEIIFADYLESKKLINQKQTIDLLIMSGNLQIKTKGKAMESAVNEGDSIRVKVLETGAILTGVVKGKENVYVEI
jgi:flagella basal body P-ring formation protein FlgA